MEWLKLQPEQMQKPLLRLIRSTKQIRMRLPAPDEDTVTMASNAVWQIAQQASNRDDISHLHYLAAGTETGVDNSKALAAYILEALSDSDIQFPTALSTFQVQHACAGGTIALFSLCALLQLSSKREETAIVVCSDIAHYKNNTTAEITQGAGAVALLLGNNPRLVELDVSRMGHASFGTDDFFRPLGSLGAKVKGNYSIKCYQDALSTAISDFAARRQQTVWDALEEHDYVVMHSPFADMARMALCHLLKQIKMSPQEIDAYIEERGLNTTTEAISMVGNIYSGSVYFVLYVVLAEQHQKIGAAIVGKKILICSYGSGYTMTVISGTIAPSAPEVIAAWDAKVYLKGSAAFTYQEYQQWMERPYALTARDIGADQKSRASARGAYLNAIREDGYREYRFKR